MMGFGVKNKKIKTNTIKRHQLLTNYSIGLELCLVFIFSRITVIKQDLGARELRRPLVQNLCDVSPNIDQQSSGLRFRITPETCKKTPAHVKRQMPKQTDNDKMANCMFCHCCNRPNTCSLLRCRRCSLTEPVLRWNGERVCRASLHLVSSRVLRAARRAGDQLSSAEEGGRGWLRGHFL